MPSSWRQSGMNEGGRDLQTTSCLSRSTREWTKQRPLDAKDYGRSCLSWFVRD